MSPMDKQGFGETEILLPRLGFAAAGFWGDSAFDESIAAEVVNVAALTGIHFIDTGSNYSRGNAEVRLGRCLKKTFGRIPRSKWIISSKAGSTALSGGVRQLLSPAQNFDFSADAIERSISTSVERMNCDYLDIIFMHLMREDHISEALLRRLTVLISDGLIRKVGVYAHDVEGLSWIKNYGEIFKVVQVPFNFLLSTSREHFRQLSKNRIEIIAGSALAQGHLLPPRFPRTRADVWYATRSRLKPHSRAIARKAKHMRDSLPLYKGMTAAQSAVAFVLNCPEIASVIVNTTRPGHLEEISQVPKLMSSLDET